jgi:hypothetical protein
MIPQDQHIVPLKTIKEDSKFQGNKELMVNYKTIGENQYECLRCQKKLNFAGLKIHASYHKSQ